MRKKVAPEREEAPVKGKVFTTRDKRYYLGDTETCPVCGKIFTFTTAISFMVNNKYVCSWDCFKKFYDEHEKDRVYTASVKPAKRKNLFKKTPIKSFDISAGVEEEQEGNVPEETSLEIPAETDSMSSIDEEIVTEKEATDKDVVEEMLW